MNKHKKQKCKQGCKVRFLDLWITISWCDRLSTSTLQKAVNLYLCHWQFLAQPPSIFYGLIYYGTVYRYYWHNTNIADFGKFPELFFNRLIDRAHQAQELAPMYIKAAQKLSPLRCWIPVKAPRIHLKTATTFYLFVHLPYHPQYLDCSKFRVSSNKRIIKETLVTEIDSFVAYCFLYF